MGKIINTLLVLSVSFAVAPSFFESLSIDYMDNACPYTKRFKRVPVSYTKDNTYLCLNGEILVCDFKDTPLTGLYESYYENGKLESETPYKNGKRDGLAKVYYKNGKLEAEIPYKNGKRDGLVTGYYKNGKLKYQFPHKNGKAEGFLKCYHENGGLLVGAIFQNGTLVSGFMYDTAGKKIPTTNTLLSILVDSLVKFKDLYPWP